MRQYLLNSLLAFAESKIPATDLPDWQRTNADNINTHLGHFAFLSMAKRGLVGVRRVLDKEGISYCISLQHCPICGELLFEVIPDQTTPAEIIEFAKTSHLKNAPEIVSSGWLHPGQFCKNGCMVRLANYGAKK